MKSFHCKSFRCIIKSIRCHHFFVSNSLKRFRMDYKRVITSSVSETTLQLCSESISLSAAKLGTAKRPYSVGALILPRSLHQCSLLWVFKATLSYNEKGEVKTRIWGHIWGSQTRNLPYSERIRIRKNDTDRDGISFSIFLQWPIYLINSVDKTKSLQKKNNTKTSAFHWRDANHLRSYWESVKVDCTSKRIQQDSFLDLLLCKHVSLTCITALARFSLDLSLCSSISSNPHNIKVSWLIDYGKLDTGSMFFTSPICEVCEICNIHITNYHVGLRLSHMILYLFICWSRPWCYFTL